MGRQPLSGQALRLDDLSRRHATGRPLPARDYSGPVFKRSQPYCGKAVPLVRLHIVLRHALAFTINVSQHRVGKSIARFRGPVKPRRRLTLIERDPFTDIVGDLPRQTRLTPA